MDNNEVGDSKDRIVKADERIRVKGREYRRLTIADASGNPTDYWVEGIGSANSDFISKSYEKPSNGYIDGEPKLMSVYDSNNELIFEYSDFATTDKVAGIGEDDIISDESNGSGLIFDIYGRQLNAIPQSGIYIVDGQKRVAK